MQFEPFKTGNIRGITMRYEFTPNKTLVSLLSYRLEQLSYT